MKMSTRGFLLLAVAVVLIAYGAHHVRSMRDWADAVALAIGAYITGLLTGARVAAWALQPK